jgi:hypothetical protein
MKQLAIDCIVLAATALLAWLAFEIVAARPTSTNEPLPCAVTDPRVGCNHVALSME